MEYLEKNDLVICPYDSNHHILQSRLNVHLLRCGNNHKDKKLVTCPFNSSHILKPEELATHIVDCKSGMKHHIEKTVEPITTAPPHPIIEASEDWDNDPTVAAYNPDDYCKNNLIVRNIRGAPPAVRREFRESERLRMLDLAGSKQKNQSKKEE